MVSSPVKVAALRSGVRCEGVVVGVGVGGEALGGGEGSGEGKGGS